MCKHTGETSSIFQVLYSGSVKLLFSLKPISSSILALQPGTYIPWTKCWCHLPSGLHHLNLHFCLLSILSAFHPCQTHVPYLSPVACVCLSWLKLQTSMCRNVSVFKALCKDGALY